MAQTFRPLHDGSNCGRRSRGCYLTGTGPEALLPLAAEAGSGDWSMVSVVPASAAARLAPHSGHAPVGPGADVSANRMDDDAVSAMRLSAVHASCAMKCGNTASVGAAGGWGVAPAANVGCGSACATAGRCGACGAAGAGGCPSCYAAVGVGGYAARAWACGMPMRQEPGPAEQGDDTQGGDTVYTYDGEDECVEATDDPAARGCSPSWVGPSRTGEDGARSAFYATQLRSVDSAADCCSPTKRARTDGWQPSLAPSKGTCAALPAVPDADWLVAQGPGSSFATAQSDAGQQQEACERYSHFPGEHYHVSFHHAERPQPHLVPSAIRFAAPCLQAQGAAAASPVAKSSWRAVATSGAAALHPAAAGALLPSGAATGSEATGPHAAADAADAGASLSNPVTGWQAGAPAGADPAFSQMLRLVDVGVNHLPNVVRIIRLAGALGGHVPVVLVQPAASEAYAPSLPPPPPPGLVRTLYQLPDGRILAGGVGPAAGYDGTDGCGDDDWDVAAQDLAAAAADAAPWPAAVAGAQVAGGMCLGMQQGRESVGSSFAFSGDGHAGRDGGVSNVSGRGGGDSGTGGALELRPGVASTEECTAGSSAARDAACRVWGPVDGSLEAPSPAADALMPTGIAMVETAHGSTRPPVGQQTGRSTGAADGAFHAIHSAIVNSQDLHLAGHDGTMGLAPAAAAAKGLPQQAQGATTVRTRPGADCRGEKIGFRFIFLCEGEGAQS